MSSQIKRLESRSQNIKDSHKIKGVTAGSRDTTTIDSMISNAVKRVRSLLDMPRPEKDSL